MNNVNVLIHAHIDRSPHHDPFKHYFTDGMSIHLHIGHDITVTMDSAEFVALAESMTAAIAAHTYGPAEPTK